VTDLMDFLSRPKKVRRGVNLAEKADALKEQRRVAKEKKEKKQTKKAKRVPTSHTHTHTHTRTHAHTHTHAIKHAIMQS
jgi:hypothetical protein